MQQEALRRVREQQRRVRRALDAGTIPEPFPPAESPPQEPAPPAPPPPQQSAGYSSPQPPRRDLHTAIDSLLRREGGGESLSSLGRGLQDTIGQAARPVQELLDSLGIGGEELIILMVMYVIFREHGDKTLLLALGYLLL
jgi:hypothetical protein